VFDVCLKLKMTAMWPQKN